MERVPRFTMLKCYKEEVTSAVNKPTWRGSPQLMSPRRALDFLTQIIVHTLWKRGLINAITIITFIIPLKYMYPNKLY